MKMNFGIDTRNVFRAEQDADVFLCRDALNTQAHQHDLLFSRDGVHDFCAGSFGLYSRAWQCEESVLCPHCQSRANDKAKNKNDGDKEIRTA